MKISKKDLDVLNSITEKRPAIVIQHILKHGHVTSEELETIYGYKHPPRAIRDVRERGINIETYHVKSTDGRSIGAYRFGTPILSEHSLSKTHGRTMLSQAIKKALIEKYGSKCFIYLQPMEERLLQIDHRIPYEIGGEQKNNGVDCYMLLSPSANRAKSWSCEHCSNWQTKDLDYCHSCFWAYPEKYTHIADKEQRNIIVTFTGNEIADYEKLISLVGLDKAEEKIKELINKYVK